MTRSRLDRARQRVKDLYQLYLDGKIKRLPQHEVNPSLDHGSRINYLYFMLPVSINFQRSSPAMWKSAFETFADAETNYLFFPEIVIRTPLEKVKADLVKHKLALQMNKHTGIWMSLCETLHQYFKDDPREIFKACDNDVRKLIHLLQKTMRKEFPYLSGPKLSNYWLYIVSRFTDVDLSHKEDISIIPDTHVIQCTVKLGLAKEGVSSLDVAQIWRNLLEGTGIAPVDMHPVLWNWSRDNFMPEV